MHPHSNSTQEHSNSADVIPMIWYSNRCTFWTNDFTKLDAKKVKGSLICPNCKSEGMKCSLDEWMKSAKRYEDKGAPRYIDFLHSTKNICITYPNGNPVKVQLVYQSWYQQNQQGMSSLSNALKEGLDKVTG